MIILVFGVGQAFVSHVFATYFTFKVVTTSCILATFQVSLEDDDDDAALSHCVVTTSTCLKSAGSASDHHRDL